MNKAPFMFDFFGEPSVKFMHINSSEREAFFLDPYRGNAFLVLDRMGQSNHTAETVVNYCFKRIPAMKTNLYHFLRAAEGSTVILYFNGDQQPPVVSIFRNMPAAMFFSFNKGEFKNMAPTQIRNTILTNLDAKSHILGSKESKISLMFDNGWKQL